MAFITVVAMVTVRARVKAKASQPTRFVRIQTAKPQIILPSRKIIRKLIILCNKKTRRIKSKFEPYACSEKRFMEKFCELLAQDTSPK